MPAAFYHNEAQKAVLMKSAETIANQRNIQVKTPIRPLKHFTTAEDYHQKHRLQASRQLMREFKAFYPNVAGWNNSTAAARVNGFLSGYGKLDQLKVEIERYGLSAESQKLLLKKAKRWR